MAPPEIVPDTKDWTWVLERACAECGFDAAVVEPADLAGAVRANADRWTQVLRQADVRRRPAAGVRGNGSRFTVETLGRYHLHDVVHHLQDVAG